MHCFRPQGIHRGDALSGVVRACAYIDYVGGHARLRHTQRETQTHITQMRIHKQNSNDFKERLRLNIIECEEGGAKYARAVGNLKIMVHIHVHTLSQRRGLTRIKPLSLCGYRRVE